MRVTAEVGNYVLLYPGASCGIFKVTKPEQGECVSPSRGWDRLPYTSTEADPAYWYLSVSSDEDWVDLGPVLSDLHKIILNIDFPILEE